MSARAADTAAASWANRAWRVFEPVHALTYFSDESRAAADQAGMKGFFMGYFAFRSAPLGAVSPGVVLATFFNFHRSRVERAIPQAWSISAPERLVEVRLEAARAALGRATAGLDEATVRQAAELARRLADSCDCVGRPIAAANQGLAVPDDPLGRLWQTVTVLREHRGDGHVVCLVDAGLDGCEALVMHAASGAVPAEVLRQSRHWSDEEWAAAVERLASRGLVEGSGEITPEGRAYRDRIEEATNRLAAAPYAAAGEKTSVAFVEAIRPVTRAVVAGGGFPAVNPIGLDATTE